MNPQQIFQLLQIATDPRNAGKHTLEDLAKIHAAMVELGKILQEYIAMKATRPDVVAANEPRLS